MTRAGAIGRTKSLAGMTPRCVSVVWGLSTAALRRVRPDLVDEGEGSSREGGAGDEIGEAIDGLHGDPSGPASVDRQSVAEDTACRGRSIRGTRA